MIEHNGYMYRFSCFVNRQKKREHKRAKDNKEIDSDTRRENFQIDELNVYA